MTADLVLAAHRWPTNAHLIADVARLGYLKRTDLVLDPTYGKGTWWKLWRPVNLVTHDLKLDGVNFRDLPYGDDCFDAVAFDPPYVSVGGRATSGTKAMHERYGIDKAPTTPAGVQALINEGLAEMVRVVKPGGIILVKCQDYVSSGKLWMGTYRTLETAGWLGLDCVDRLEHIGHPRPQPPGRKQVHARRNLSTLFVFRKV